MDYKKQKNIYQIIRFNRLGDFTTNIDVPFDVKEIRIRLAYSFYFDNNINVLNYLVKSDLVDGDVIGNLTQFSFTKVVPDPPDPDIDRDFYIDKFDDRTMQSFRFTQPVRINGTFTTTITSLSANIPPTDGNILIYYEFLG